MGHKNTTLVTSQKLPKGASTNILEWLSGKNMSYSGNWCNVTAQANSPVMMQASSEFCWERSPDENYRAGAICELELGNSVLIKNICFMM